MGNFDLAWGNSGNASTVISTPDGACIVAFIRESVREAEDTSVGVGESISLLRQRYRDIFLSDTKLNISDSFRPGSGDEWLMLEKYPIDGCIDSEQTKPLSLRDLLDLPDDDESKIIKINLRYINDMFEEFNPFHDGLSSTERDQFDGSDYYGHHVGIFEFFGNRKAKVVSSMGEQSCRKAHMDVPPNDKDIVREFILGFNSLVAEVRSYYCQDTLLFEENPNFLRLSGDLRAYFEEHIQSREDAIEDSEWFANLERYFKYIIERGIFRVQEWFTQNTTKFP
ncbi:11633_t:CDS:2 [Acaulospora morrowiae]|uniref:11633_t:CDS:1 n=1 Tax=Acaulospora morrowiae TaxID=94023 RepID=A0A9N8VDS7_9GLOM|nr:11633_t:CDS:2 [Acaulospora morrowiae]